MYGMYVLNAGRPSEQRYKTLEDALRHCKRYDCNFITTPQAAWVLSFDESDGGNVILVKGTFADMATRDLTDYINQRRRRDWNETDAIDELLRRAMYAGFDPTAADDDKPNLTPLEFTPYEAAARYLGYEIDLESTAAAGISDAGYWE